VVGLLPVRAIWQTLGTSGINRIDGFGGQCDGGSDPRDESGIGKCAGLHARRFVVMDQAEATKRKGVTSGLAQAMVIKQAFGFR
jgi:hypothetical protein